VYVSLPPRRILSWPGLADLAVQRVDHWVFQVPEPLNDVSVDCGPSYVASGRVYGRGWSHADCKSEGQGGINETEGSAIVH
jgi:hypothetical protein